ncbi:putative Ulp1 peptidase [Helianthus annuus]|nr:putative Ulp1 peptidase [Helianthus annuus]
MGALTSNRFKRHSDSQISSPAAFGYDQIHVSKKLKPSGWASGSVSTFSGVSSVSRLRLYPNQVTPIVREIQAPCVVVRGFGYSCSGNSRAKLDKLGNSGGRMDLFTKYLRAKEDAKGSCRFVSFEKDEEVVEVIEVDDENDGSAVVESEREDVVNKLGELQDIRDKYRELDVKAEENVGLQPSTSSGAVLELLDGKGLESLSLEPRVDAGLPYHKKLLIESARKHDMRLQRLNFDIKLQEERRALFKQLTPAKKDESKKDEDVLLEPFRPLTEDDKEMVADALSSSSRRKVLVTHDNSNITITGEVLRCLRPGAWLNDEVINLYLELLKEREKKEPKKFLKCHFFNTFFYKKLISGRTGYDYKSVRRWTTQRKLGYSLLECDKIFVPVHKEIHWCLAVINKKEEKFQYLDSLGGVDKQVMRVLAKYFVDEVKDKNGEDIDVTSWQQEYVTDLPNQQNGFDCGVFMIKYADFYSRDIGLCFKQEHMPYFRLRTAKEILRLRAD